MCKQCFNNEIIGLETENMIVEGDMFGKRYS